MTSADEAPCVWMTEDRARAGRIERGEDEGEATTREGMR